MAFENISSVLGLGILRAVEDRFGKGKFQHDLPVIVGHFQDCVEKACLPALCFQDFPDRRPRHVPGVIGIAQFLPLGIEDQFGTDTRVEEISRHGRDFTSVGCSGGRAATCHKFFFGNSPCPLKAGSTEYFAPPDGKPLIGHRFIQPHEIFHSFILHRNTKLSKNNSLANFYNRISLYGRAKIVPNGKETVMSWKTPKIVEVPVGMEINMYACAARK
jgi:coenzyme PQQ precursor peptide PqqA